MHEANEPKRAAGALAVDRAEHELGAWHGGKDRMALLVHVQVLLEDLQRQDCRAQRRSRQQGSGRSGGIIEARRPGKPKEAIGQQKPRHDI